MLIYSTKLKYCKENLEDLRSATDESGLEANSGKFMCHHIESQPFMAEPTVYLQYAGIKSTLKYSSWHHARLGFKCFCTVLTCALKMR